MTETTTPPAAPQAPSTKYSPEIGEIAAALAAAQGEITTADKGRANEFFKASYATLADVWAACRAALSKHGLAVFQAVQTNEAGRMTLETTLAHKSGQWVRSFYPINPVKQDPQGYGSATTYARRYSLAALVGVAPNDKDEDDGEAAMGREKQKARKGDVDGYMEQSGAKPPEAMPTADDLIATMGKLTAADMATWKGLATTKKFLAALKKSDAAGYERLVAKGKALAAAAADGPEPPADAKLPEVGENG